MTFYRINIGHNRNTYRYFFNTLCFFHMIAHRRLKRCLVSFIVHIGKIRLRYASFRNNLKKKKDRRSKKRNSRDPDNTSKYPGQIMKHNLTSPKLKHLDEAN